MISIVWWLFLLFLALLFLASWIVCFFVMRNNPKYFGIDKMLKARRDELASMGKGKLIELQAKVADAIKSLS